MAVSVFYSWQSDRPNPINRNFIRRALEQAVTELQASLSLEDAVRPPEIVLDQDTQGVPGSPEIANTILDKIETCGVFVPDVTFVSDDAAHDPVPNPNVMLEYGWALAKIGDQRLMPIMNTAYGAPDQLPFDLGHRRWPITYHLSEHASKVRRREYGPNLCVVFFKH